MAFKILLVDDEFPTRKSIIRELRGLEVQITERENGQEALDELLAKEKSGEVFDLLITDHLMPELKGFELIAQAKIHFPNLPIILLSGTLNEEDVPEGAIFIHKPWENNQIKELVEQIIVKTKQGS